MINANLARLPFKWKVTLSSAVIGLILSLNSVYREHLPLEDDKLFGMYISIWEWSLFFGCMLSWAAWWKKDYKSAPILFAAGMGTNLFLNGYFSLLPEPFNTFFGYASIAFPIAFVLLCIKIAVERGWARLNKQTIFNAYIGVVLFHMLNYYLPVLMIGYNTENFLFAGSGYLFPIIYSPLFYLIFYRIQAGKEWKSIIPVEAISRGKFLSYFLPAWSLLLLSLYRLPSVVGSYSTRLDVWEEDKFLFFTAFSNALYFALTVLGLGYLCARLLTSWHLTIKKPLGWLYLLSFVPLLNIITLIYLLNLKPDTWNSPGKWHEHLEAERNKIAIGVVVLTIIGSFVSAVVAVMANNQVLEGSLYSSLLLSALSAVSIYALYKGWAPFWAVSLVYISLYIGILLMGVFSSPEPLESSAIVRCLVLFIYYQAIKPNANEKLRQEVAAVNG